MPYLYLGADRVRVGLDNHTQVVISGYVDVPVYGINAGYVSVDDGYQFNKIAGAGISYVGNEVRIRHGASHIDVGPTGILLSFNDGMSMMNMDSMSTVIKNSRVVISSAESCLKDAYDVPYQSGDLRIGDQGRIISQP